MPQRAAVFPNPSTGAPWQDIRKAFRRAVVASELEGLWFRDLRRSFVTRARKLGISESVVMRMSGHRTRALFDRYNIVDERDLREAVRVLEKVGRVLDTVPVSGLQKRQSPYRLSAGRALVFRSWWGRDKGRCRFHIARCLHPQHPWGYGRRRSSPQAQCEGCVRRPTPLSPLRCALRRNHPQSRSIVVRPKSSTRPGKRAKLTQLQLAVRAGLDPSTIAQAERLHGVASFETKLKLAKVLGLEPMDLFKRTA